MTSFHYVKRALQGALRNFFHPVILAVAVLPAIVAVAVWSGLTWWFWDVWTGAIQSGFASATSGGWLARLELSDYGGMVAGTVVLMLVGPAILVTAMLISAIFAMPILVAHVAKQDFPSLERRRGGTFAGSIANAVVAVAAFAVLWLVTLPLWIVLGPFAVTIPWALSAYLNQRLFRYDALSEHADASEMRRIFDERFSDLFVLGLVTGLLYFVPVINLVAPVFSALVYAWLCLDELARLRAMGGEGALLRG